MSDRCSKCLKLMPEEDVNPPLCRKCAKARIEALEGEALTWVAQRDEIMEARGRVIVQQYEEIQKLKAALRKTRGHYPFCRCESCLEAAGWQD